MEPFLYFLGSGLASYLYFLQVLIPLLFFILLWFGQEEAFGQCSTFLVVGVG
jgi:hypothetical protein